MSILFDFHDDLVVEEMNFPWTDPSITAIKAGTPLDEDGAIANNGDAVGLVAYTLPHGGDNLLGVASSNADGSLYIKVKVIKSGYVNLAEVEASFGSALTDACKSALTGIHFITDIGSGGGGGGGGVPSITASDVGKYLTAEAETTVITIIPEQTVTFSGTILLNGVTIDPASLQLGQTAIATATAEMMGTTRVYTSVMTVVEEDGALQYQGEIEGHPLKVYYNIADERWEMYANLYSIEGVIKMESEQPTGRYEASWIDGKQVVEVPMTINEGVYTMTLTYREIRDHFYSGKVVVCSYNETDDCKYSFLLVAAYDSALSDNKAHLYLIGTDLTNVLLKDAVANNEDGYPSWSNGGVVA